MIVEPVPTAPRSPRHRRLQLAGLLAPVALLIVVVATALAGPLVALQGAPTAPTPAPPSQAAVAVPRTPTGPAAPAPASFPTVAADLAVRSIPEAQAWLDELTPGPFAVAGWLTDLYPYGPCPAAGGDTRGALGPLCPRRARLAAEPEGPGSDAHIRLTIPAGTRLPPTLELAGRLPSAVAIVVVGHTGEKQIPCEATDNDCRSDLVVERVTWADSAPFDPGPIYDAYLDVAPPPIALRNLDSAETLAIGWYGTVLQAALIRPSTVAEVDPDAARAMAASPRPGSLVWYVRGLETGYDPVHALHGEAPPRYSWVVLDYQTGATLAVGPYRELRP